MYNMSPYSLSRSFRDKPCRAVIYGRASTEHEAQVKALHFSLLLNCSFFDSSPHK